jgi:hypothetical protein
MELNNTVNPKAALDALFPQPIDCGEGVEVKPFSLATYALLEKIGSYVIFPHEPTQEEVLKTLYICTHDAKQVFKDFDKLGDLAFDWASGLRPAMVNTITEAILKQVDAVRRAMPPEEGPEKNPPQTDGSQV